MPRAAGDLTVHAGLCSSELSNCDTAHNRNLSLGLILVPRHYAAAPYPCKRPMIPSGTGSHARASIQKPYLNFRLSGMVSETREVERAQKSEDRSLDSRRPALEHGRWAGHLHPAVEQKLQTLAPGEKLSVIVTMAEQARLAEMLAKQLPTPTARGGDGATSRISRPWPAGIRDLSGIFWRGFDPRLIA